MHCVQIQLLSSCRIERKHVRPHCSDKNALFSNIRSKNLVEINENDKDENTAEKAEVRGKRRITALGHLLILQN